MFSAEYAEFNSTAAQGHIRDTCDYSDEEQWLR